MPWWKRRTAVNRDDAVFGSIVRDRYGWKVNAEHVPLISVVAGDDGPTDAQRVAHQELQSQLRSFASDLTAALYEMYSPYLELRAWEGPRPRSAEDLRNMLELSS